MTSITTLGHNLSSMDTEMQDKVDATWTNHTPTGWHMENTFKKVYLLYF